MFQPSNICCHRPLCLLYLLCSLLGSHIGGNGVVRTFKLCTYVCKHLYVHVYVGMCVHLELVSQQIQGLPVCPLPLFRLFLLLLAAICWCRHWRCFLRNNSNCAIICRFVDHQCVCTRHTQLFRSWTFFLPCGLHLGCLLWMFINSNKSVFKRSQRTWLLGLLLFDLVTPFFIVCMYVHIYVFIYCICNYLYECYIILVDTYV